MYPSELINEHIAIGEKNPKNKTGFCTKLNKCSKI